RAGDDRRGIGGFGGGIGGGILALDPAVGIAGLAGLAGTLGLLALGQQRRRGRFLSLTFVRGGRPLVLLPEQAEEGVGRSGRNTQGPCRKQEGGPAGQDGKSHRDRPP